MSTKKDKQLETLFENVMRQAVEIPLKERIEEAIQQMIDEVIADTGRGRMAINLLPLDCVGIFTLEMTEIIEYTGQMQIVGLPGSSVCFVDESNIIDAEFPGDSNWFRTLIQEHLAVTPQSLVIVIPAWITAFLIIDSLPEEERETVQGFWEECKQDSELHRQRQIRAQTESVDAASASKTIRDWDYCKAYIAAVQNFVEKAAWDKMTPSQIRTAIRTGRHFREHEGTQLPDMADSYFTGIRDAAYDCGSGKALVSDCVNSEDETECCDAIFDAGYEYESDDGLETGLTAAIKEIENIMAEFEDSQYPMETVLHRLGEVVFSLQLMYPGKDEEIDDEE